MYENDDSIVVNFFTTKEDAEKKGLKEVLSNLLLNGIVFGFDDDGLVFFYSINNEAEDIILEASRKYPLVYFFWSAGSKDGERAVNTRFHDGKIVKRQVCESETE